MVSEVDPGGPIPSNMTSQHACAASLQSGGKKRRPCVCCCMLRGSVPLHTSSLKLSICAPNHLLLTQPTTAV